VWLEQSENPIAREDKGQPEAKKLQRNTWMETASSTLVLREKSLKA
jgi:hypothetical protein